MYYDSLNKTELQKELDCNLARYNAFKQRNISLDMSRGKPGPEQLDISSKEFDSLTDIGYKNETGIDCRNYGGLDGLPELKSLFADVFGIDKSQVIVGGNASLNMMFDTVAQGMTHGFGCGPWLKQTPHSRVIISAPRGSTSFSFSVRPGQAFRKPRV